MNTRLINDRFPRSNLYNPAWVDSGVSGGANPLWLTEWLTTAMDLRHGFRVLDLGCGRAMSSIFLSREFGVQVWATDLWFSASENLQRVRGAGVEDGVFPIHADARSLPFANDFFDSIVAIDSFPYFGTDQHYLNYLARFVKPGGSIAIAGAGLTHEVEGEIPPHLRAWWEREMWSLHSAAWWRSHWERSEILDMQLADAMPEGWRYWLEWQKTIASDNLLEIEALEADQGSYLGYIRAIGRRPGAKLDDPITAVPTEYTPQSLLR